MFMVLLAAFIAFDKVWLDCCVESYWLGIIRRNLRRFQLNVWILTPFMDTYYGVIIPSKLTVQIVDSKILDFSEILRAILIEIR